MSERLVDTARDRQAPSLPQGLREVVYFLLTGAICEGIYLAVAASGLYLKGLPLDYEHWGSYLIMAIIVIPQAFAVGYLAWIFVLRRILPWRYDTHFGTSVLLGAVLGCLYYALGANVRWVVPWMVLLTKGS